tara:strand:- start:497 stop:637 length:141 start_codon:yes stop_codon:yes gene_type:complete
MIIEKKKMNGTIQVSDIIDGQLITKTYIGYTKRQAMKLFKRERKRK